MFLRCAREKNNHAVACLQAGDAQRAVEMLQQALVELNYNKNINDNNNKQGGPKMMHPYQNTPGAVSDSDRNRDDKDNNSNGERRKAPFNGEDARPTKRSRRETLPNKQHQHQPQASSPLKASLSGTTTTTAADHCCNDNDNDDHNSNDNYNNDNDTTTPHNHSNQLQHHCCYMESTPLHVYKTSEHCKVQMESYLPMYDRALLLLWSDDDDERDDDDEKNQNDQQHNTMVRGVILYNMALANHCCGLYEGQSGSLSTALVLYQMCMEMLLYSAANNECAPSSSPSSSSPFFCCSCNSKANLLLLAAVYNAAQIHASLLHGHQVRQLLEFCRLILAFPAGGAAAAQQQPRAIMIGMDDYTFFWLHATMFPPGKELRLAPAA